MSRAVYAIQSDIGPIKIGVAKHPKTRLDTLLLQQPYTGSLVYSRRPAKTDALAIEATVHSLLDEKRYRGEWFNITPEQAKEAIDIAFEMMGDVGADEPPAPPKKQRVVTTLSRKTVAEVEEWRSKQRPIPSINNAFLELVSRALDKFEAEENAKTALLLEKGLDDE